MVLKAEPIEQLTVEDADTDDETSAVRRERDLRANEQRALVRIKQEPIDPGQWRPTGLFLIGFFYIELPVLCVCFVLFHCIEDFAVPVGSTVAVRHRGVEFDMLDLSILDFDSCQFTHMHYVNRIYSICKPEM